MNRAALLEKLVCPECDATRIKTPSGATCPNGHGRIQPNVKAHQVRAARRLRWMMELPVATTSGKGAYSIGGLEGVWEVSPFEDTYIPPGTRYVPTGGTPASGVLAVIRGQRWSARRFLSINVAT